jgi:L-rhamnose mutarotase
MLEARVMSQTSTNTSYSLTLQDNINGQFGYFSLSSGGGADDATVLALAETLKNFAWASAMGPITIQVSRNDETDTFYNGDLSTNPPTFK